MEPLESVGRHRGVVLPPDGVFDRRACGRRTCPSASGRCGCRWRPAARRPCPSVPSPRSSAACTSAGSQQVVEDSAQPADALMLQAAGRVHASVVIMRAPLHIVARLFPDPVLTESGRQCGESVRSHPEHLTTTELYPWNRRMFVSATTADSATTLRRGKAAGDNAEFANDSDLMANWSKNCHFRCSLDLR